jgi:O-antigen ligase
MAIFLVMQAVQFRKHDKVSRWIAGVGAIMIAVCIAAFVLYAKDSRLAGTAQEITQFETQNKVTSMGLRYEYYRRSIELIAHRPFYGYGAGSVRTEFERLQSANAGANFVMIGNPHNEFLLMGVQLGVVGVALLVALFITLALECSQLAAPERGVAIGYLFAFALGCCANSLLLNFTEGNLLVFLVGILIAAAPRRESQSRASSAGAASN